METSQPKERRKHKLQMYWEANQNEISSEFICETCGKSLKNYKEVGEHSIKFKHYSYRNSDMVGMRLMVV